MIKSEAYGCCFVIKRKLNTSHVNLILKKQLNSDKIPKLSYLCFLLNNRLSFFKKRQLILVLYRLINRYLDP